MIEDQYSVTNEDTLYRWIHPSQYNKDERRASSGAFTQDYMSTDIAKLTTLEESYHRSQQQNKDGVIRVVAISSFSAEVVISAEQKIVHCKTFVDDQQQLTCIAEEECSSYKKLHEEDLICTNPAHACVIGKKGRSLQRKIARSAEIVIHPPGV